MVEENKSHRNRKLVDLLGTYEDTGDLVGFWATSFEFDTDFFRMDFLPQILGLPEWDPNGTESRIRQERRLERADAAAVMIDRRRYDSRPVSLRVDLIPAGGARGRMLHAKVLFVLCERGARLLVGSHNLTNQGYRVNREVSALFTLSESDTEYVGLFRTALDGARSLLGPWWKESVELVSSEGTKWLERFGEPKGDEDVRFLWSGGDEPLWKKVLSEWPDGEAVEEITIVSPFWSEERGDGPVASLVKELRTKNSLQSGARVFLLCEAACPKEGSWAPSLPESYGSVRFPDLGITCWAAAVDPRAAVEGAEETKGGIRPLHAKIVLLKGRNRALAYLGSANFTRKGWGFLRNPGTANIEAGVLLPRDGKDIEELEALIPSHTGELLELNGSVEVDRCKPPPYPVRPWPFFLQEVLLVSPETPSKRFDLLVKVDPERVRGRWSVEFLPDVGDAAGAVLCRHDRGEVPDHIRVEPDEATLKRLFKDREVLVRWWRCSDGVCFPINTDLRVRAALPAVPEAGPLSEKEILGYYRGKILKWRNGGDSPPGQCSDARSHEYEVDTSNIQSYVIREFVLSLEGMKKFLRDSAHSRRRMRVALLGGLSPVRLAEAIMEAVREGKRSPTAAGFQLVEILSCLREIDELPQREEWKYCMNCAGFRISKKLQSLRRRRNDVFSSSKAFSMYQEKVLGSRADGGRENDPACA